MKSSTIGLLLLAASIPNVVISCPPQAPTSDNPLSSSNNVESRRSIRGRFVGFDSKTDDVDFLLLDDDKDDFIDACELMMAPFNDGNYSLRDFVQADIDGDDRLSLEEFLSMKSTVTRKEEYIEDTIATR